MYWDYPHVTKWTCEVLGMVHTLSVTLTLFFSVMKNSTSLIQNRVMGGIEFSRGNEAENVVSHWNEVKQKR